MKNLNYKEQIAYASAFISFILPKIEQVNEIILFGSAARGESAKDSDIDLFFNTEKENEEKIKKTAEAELKKFYKSKIAEIWSLNGISNNISIKVGDLNKWKLKRSIISDGIYLYGRYKEMPENLNNFVFFNISPIKNITKRNRVLRKIFGRKETGFSKEGILQAIKGKKLSPSSFVVYKKDINTIIKLLGEEKVNYQLFEFWTDNINLE